MAAASHTLLILGGAARAVPMVYPGTGVVPRASKEVVKMQTRNPGYRKGGKLSSDGGGGGVRHNLAHAIMCRFFLTQPKSEFIWMYRDGLLSRNVRHRI